VNINARQLAGGRYWIALFRELACKRCQPPRNNTFLLASPCETEAAATNTNHDWPSHPEEDSFDTQMLRPSPHP
jgi:hypothetical protein